MNSSWKTGMSFGLTSAVITTLGIIVGLTAGTHSKVAVIGGILVIAIADAFSDALGIHISEESEGKHTEKEVWQSTIATFITKMFFASTFLIPVLAFEELPAVIISVVWGLSLLAFFSYYLAIKQKKEPMNVIFEHVIIALLVIIITYYVGEFVATVFV